MKLPILWGKKGGHLWFLDEVLQFSNFNSNYHIPGNRVGSRWKDIAENKIVKNFRNALSFMYQKYPLLLK